ncbi:MAG: hypothetical protein R3C68_01630, partial [Myxococcota bacterium]
MLKRFCNDIKSRRRAYGLAALSGVLYFTGFCGLEQFYLSWICLVPILWALDDQHMSGRQALAVAWFFGLVTHLGGYTWICGMLHEFAYLPWPLAVFGYVLLCVAQGSLLGVWGWGMQGLSRRFGVSLVWGAPVIMVLAEGLYPALFPSYLANSQYRQLAFIQSLEIWGPLGLSFILTLSSAVIYATLAWKFRDSGRFPAVGWLVLLSLVVGNALYGLAAINDTHDTVRHIDRR